MLTLIRSSPGEGRCWDLFLILAFTRFAWAGGVVTECTESSLRNAMTGGGRITFACDGTITLAAMLTVADNLALDATGHAVCISGSNAVRVFYVPTNALVTLINLTVQNGFAAQGAGLFNDGGTVILKDISFLTNKTMTTVVAINYTPGAGGAVYNRFGRVNATNCSFMGNVASQPLAFGPPISASGGAIYNEQGEINLDGCWLSDNRATGVGAAGHEGYSEGVSAFGGAICSTGQLNLNRCAFRNNAVMAGAGTASVYDQVGGPGGKAEGGAIYNAGYLRMVGTSFMHNSGAGGNGCDTDGVGWDERPGPPGGEGGEARGGAISSFGELWADSCTFASNSLASGDGGHGGLGRQSQLSWMGQQGGPGGTGGAAKGSALFVGAETRLVNCTVAWNLSSGGKGGQGGRGGPTARVGAPGGSGGSGGNGGGGQASILDPAGNLTMTNCTIALNGATGGEGGSGGPGGESGPWATVPYGPNGSPGTNGLALGGINIAGGQLVNTLLVTNSGGNCFGAILDLGHNLSSDGTPAFIAQGSRNNTDPGLGDLGEYGGSPPTMTLLAGSPAIDAADTVSAPAYDQRGFARPLGRAADIGACEYAELTLHTPTFVGSESFAFEVRGTLGVRFAVESASPSLDWKRLCTNTLSGSPFNFVDGNATGLSERYYRALVLPVAH